MAKNYDVFNGDADGICALQQLRLVKPKQATLITGLKRDIGLLAQCNADKNTTITVLDVSLDTNREALLSVLSSGSSVFYADHHFTGDVPKHKNFEAHLNLSANTCTALIVNKYLNNAYPLWAIVGAFGDNLNEAAIALAKTQNLSSGELEQLKQLGICLNYNGYGFSLDDLIYHPADLYKMLSSYQSPLVFIKQSACFEQLFKAYKQDLALANKQKPIVENETGVIFILDNNKWARRVSGVFGNSLARQQPNKAHAVLVQSDNGYRVSVRAPLNNKKGADVLCRKFKSGGGRKAAAGINCLPAAKLDDFKTAFFEQF